MKKGIEKFRERLNTHIEELKWLYMELYDNEAMFAELCAQMEKSVSYTHLTLPTTERV